MMYSILMPAHNAFKRGIKSTYMLITPVYQVNKGIIVPLDSNVYSISRNTVSIKDRDNFIILKGIFITKPFLYILCAFYACCYFL